MKTYFGTVTVEAKPATNFTHGEDGKELVLDGYEISFNGTISWMPKDKFEEIFEYEIIDEDEL